MTDLFASVAGHRVTRLRLHVPNVGPWFLDAELDDDTALAGRVAVKIGSLELSGTVDERWSGTFATSTRVRVIAGAGGWGTTLAAKSYHNDAGVRVATVCGDAAREAGETLGDFVPPGDVVGNDYVRAAGPASHVLSDTLGGVPWWVGYDGITRAGPRPSSTPKAGSFELLGFEPMTKLATLSTDDPAAIGIGSVLSDRLAEPQIVREIELLVEGGKLRLSVWCGGDENTHSRIARALFGFLRIASGKLFGKYRYRVVSVAADGRVNLQAVTKARGLPDVLPVTMRPGVAGAWADLVLGSEVLLEFIAGDPKDPIVTGFPGRGEPGFIPSRLILCADSPGSAPAAARQGDAVKVLLPPATLTGTFNGAPITGVVMFPTLYTLGSITTGSGKLGIGT